MSGYDGNGEGYFSAHGKGGDHGGSSSYDAFEDRNSLQKNNSRESDRGRPRTRERDRDREKDRDRSYRDSEDRSSRADRGKGRYGDYDRHWHGYDRHRDYDRDRERRDGHRSRSRSKDRSRKLSRSPSRSKSVLIPNLVSSAIGGAEGPDRIFVGGLPYYFTEAQIRELLESFGPLRGFDLVKDRDTGNSKGYGFCVYQDPAVTDIACGALNGLKMGDKTLTVRRATVSSGQAKSEQENILAQAQQHIAIQKMVLQAGGLSVPGGVATAATEETPTKVLCLTEAITPDELKDNEEYEEILEDMRDECGKFGALVDIIIPRPNPNGEQTPGVGKVFLEYSDTTSCASARNVLNGRKFGGNTVSAVYFPEDKFYNRDYSE